ncbi:AAEL000357-PA [Aedes aegypti]|uniref:AAEL000357-PA n=2 Tax=Aedes aegypti TaxID=7159 RepID=A0A1S4EVN2_AEDAE|nr:cytochrome P450 4c21 [Aedes aegypti]EAT48676.1 AAEL000357-PA [Aedes aegypti]
MFLFLLLVCAILAFFAIRDHLRKTQAFAENLPIVVPEKSFLGINYDLLGLNDEERFELVNRIFLQQDRLFRMSIGPMLILGVSHPDLVQKLLSHPDCLEKPFFYDFVKYDQGIFSAKFKLWKSQRKALNPTFNLRILHSFVPIFEKCSKKLVSELEKCKDGDTVNMFKYTSRCALEMVCGTTLGSDVLQRDGKEVFLTSLEELFLLVSRRMLSMHLYSDLIYMMTPHYWKELIHRKRCKAFTKKILQEKKEARRYGATPESTPDSDPEADDFKKPQIFIDQLLSTSESSRPFTDEEIFHNVFVIMVAGNDTSGLATAYACLFLGMYPHIQEKVYAEVMEHFPNEDVEMTGDSLKQLEYTEMFLKEVLRHCPVAANIARQCIKDIEIDGTRVPAGNLFIFTFWAMHRRKDIWGPDADKFDPDNFLPERVQARNPNAYMPFSSGSRNCIGGRYAMISIKVMLVYLLRRFKLHTNLKHEDLRYKFGITLRLSTSHMVQLERRKC